MKTITFNKYKSRWIFTFTEFDFEIKYRFEKINSIDGSLRRSDYKKTDDKICLLILQNKLKNIIVIIVNLIFIMTRDFERTLTECTKSTFNMFSFKKIDEKNVKKLFDIDKNDLFYNIMTQQFRWNDVRETYNSER